MFSGCEVMVVSVGVRIAPQSDTVVSHTQQSNAHLAPGFEAFSKRHHATGAFDADTPSIERDAVEDATVVVTQRVSHTKRCAIFSPEL